MKQINPTQTQVILIGASEFDDESFPNLPNVKTNLLKLNDLFIDVVEIDKNQICVLATRFGEAVGIVSYGIDFRV